MLNYFWKGEKLWNGDLNISKTDTLNTRLLAKVLSDVGILFHVCNRVIKQSKANNLSILFLEYAMLSICGLLRF
jgi:hypothetical protein